MYELFTSEKLWDHQQSNHSLVKSMSLSTELHFNHPSYQIMLTYVYIARDLKFCKVKLVTPINLRYVLYFQMLNEIKISPRVSVLVGKDVRV